MGGISESPSNDVYKMGAILSRPVFRAFGTMRGFLYHFGLTLSTGIALAAANVARPLGYDAHQANLNSCKGYVVTSVREGRGYLRADLKLAAPCGVYKQKDVENLVLEVDYQDGECGRDVRLGAIDHC